LLYGGNMDRREHTRFVKRLKTTFYMDEISFTGISSNISKSGLFIRTSKGFSPDTIINIEMVMPDNTISNLKGIVTRTIKTPFTSMKNGMGVRLLEKDVVFMDFIESLST
jgi:hypothetical protein